MFLMASVDRTFLIVFILLIALVVFIYFSNPIINHKKFKKDRQELEQREKLYRENHNAN